MQARLAHGHTRARAEGRGVGAVVEGVAEQAGRDGTGGVVVDGRRPARGVEGGRHAGCAAEQALGARAPRRVVAVRGRALPVVLAREPVECVVGRGGGLGLGPAHAIGLAAQDARVAVRVVAYGRGDRRERLPAVAVHALRHAASAVEGVRVVALVEVKLIGQVAGRVQGEGLAGC